MSYTYKYPRPAVTVDAAVLKNACINCEILLIKRLNPPFSNCWALPGGFVDMNETLEEAVVRELEEETGLKNIILNQFKTYSDIDRDPRGRTISVVFAGLAKETDIVRPGDDATEAKWFSINKLPKLAFDHEQIITELIKNF